MMETAKPTVCRAFCGVVAVRPEMRLIFGRVAGDDIALHSRDVEVMDLENLRHNAPQGAGLRGLDKLGISDRGRFWVWS